MDLVFIFTTILLGFRLFGSINGGSVVSVSEQLATPLHV